MRQASYRVWIATPNVRLGSSRRAGVHRSTPPCARRRLLMTSDILGRARLGLRGDRALLLRQGSHFAARPRGDEESLIHADKGQVED